MQIELTQIELEIILRLFVEIEDSVDYLDKEEIALKHKIEEIIYSYANLE